MSMRFVTLEMLGLSCPCGARRDTPNGRCRKCSARSAWSRRKTHRNRHHSARALNRKK
jgi:hypothetical protein